MLDGSKPGLKIIILTIIQLPFIVYEIILSLFQGALEKKRKKNRTQFLFASSYFCYRDPRKITSL